MIGIITFHRALSYGAVLQTYGLQHALNKIDVENEVIDYECKYIYDHYVRVFSKGQNIKYLIKSLLIAGKKKRWNKYQTEFRTKYLKTSRYVSKEQLGSIEKEYDFIISGSDQVFSPTCAGFDSAYFLDFTSNGKKRSYAASFGVEQLKDIYKDKVKGYLEGFERISVRENSGLQILDSMGIQSGEQHIDPTFLLKSSEWDEVVEEEKLFKEPYILLFSVNKPKQMIDYAISLGKQENMKVYYLQNYSFPKREGLEFIGPVRPGEFINLIKNATYVVTNSFHGLAFSIIYHKKFVVELETASGVNARAKDLLKLLHIEGVSLSEVKGQIPNPIADWSQVENTLEKERDKSLKYLTEITKCN